MTAKRIVTSVILVITLSTIFYIGHVSLLLMTTIVSLFTTFEIIKAFKSKNHKIYTSLCLTTNVIYFICLFLFPKISTTLLFKTLILLITLFTLLELFSRNYFTFKNGIFNSIKIILQIPLPLSTIYFIRTTELGLLSCFLLISCVIMSDTAAYFGGKLFGQNKLISLSPKKTVEGLIIGFIMTLMLGISIIMVSEMNIFKFSLITLIIAITAPLGDLHESLFKRFFKIKDSSTLLPGHGGVYDRIDSYLLALPLAFLLL